MNSVDWCYFNHSIIFPVEGLRNTEHRGKNSHFWHVLFSNSLYISCRVSISCLFWPARETTWPPAVVYLRWHCYIFWSCVYLLIFGLLLLLTCIRGSSSTSWQIRVLTAPAVGLRSVRTRDGKKQTRTSVIFVFSSRCGIVPISFLIFLKRKSVKVSRF